KRVARSCGVEHGLRIDHILIAIRVKCEDAHAGTKFKINHVNGGADADDEVGSTKGAGDGWKGDATFEVELRPGDIEKRRDIGESRPQGELDIVDGDYVGADPLADEALERFLFIEKKGYRYVQSCAAIGISRWPA